MSRAYDKKERIIISLGGSLLVPEGIDTEFISNFKKFIVSHIKKGYRFILVTGGGRTARQYIDVAGQITKITDEDRDWLGIHATRMNAHLVRTIFREYAHPRINTNPHDLEDFYRAPEPILVAAGWRPGFSTDFDAVVLGKYLDVNRIINLSNIERVYSKDPRVHADAVPFEEITWKDFRKIVGSKWNPGMNVPFDPIASEMAEKEHMEVAVMNGGDMKNVENYIAGKKFIGTRIKD
ncbi:MAG: UMP kinase [Candidatus Moranbacteria bacterium]|nr:UMP kinase [Candidatus Moranbacteria bacterium]MDD3965040.1 UMP kinase [Candidatus Moranbacteria bacterium]